MDALESLIARVEFNADAHAVEVICKDFHSSIQILDVLDQTETIRSGMRIALEQATTIAHEQKCVTWIGDLHTLLLLTGDDERWSLQEWLPRLRASGIINIALVPPTTILGHLFFDSIIQQAVGLNIQKVKSLEEAQAWAKQQLN
jgi:hypothetical protein